MNVLHVGDKLYRREGNKVMPYKIIAYDKTVTPARLLLEDDDGIREICTVSDIERCFFTTYIAAEIQKGDLLYYNDAGYIKSCKVLDVTIDAITVTCNGDKKFAAGIDKVGKTVFVRLKDVPKFSPKPGTKVKPRPKPKSNKKDTADLVLSSSAAFSFTGSGLYDSPRGVAIKPNAKPLPQDLIQTSEKYSKPGIQKEDDWSRYDYKIKEFDLSSNVFVHPGCDVQIVNIDTRERENYRFVKPDDNMNDEEAISNRTPLGMSMFYIGQKLYYKYRNKVRKGEIIRFDDKKHKLRLKLENGKIVDGYYYQVGKTIFRNYEAALHSDDKKIVLDETAIELDFYFNEHMDEHLYGPSVRGNASRSGRAREDKYKRNAAGKPALKVLNKPLQKDDK
ncbi:GreA/GreB family elongation factor [Anaerovorax odorimutans]|uniref:GreA/GreB family elongation factor n=1 Tax=Anaerovorax odorimutans TaxID=109327 RepID=A0ABT1RKZ8_9FIRM|nr:GreA/GreB family elongation factor [Anaerovorax odorimutans]MCQ4635857.1 GreA/GreB family elongation factor [Anaerovorax odorimutans]